MESLGTKKGIPLVHPYSSAGATRYFLLCPTTLTDDVVPPPGGNRESCKRTSVQSGSHGLAGSADEGTNHQAAQVSLDDHRGVISATGKGGKGGVGGRGDGACL